MSAEAAHIARHRRGHGGGRGGGAPPSCARNARKACRSPLFFRTSFFDGNPIFIPLRDGVPCHVLATCTVFEVHRLVTGRRSKVVFQVRCTTLLCGDDDYAHSRSTHPAFKIQDMKLAKSIHELKQESKIINNPLEITIETTSDTLSSTWPPIHGAFRFGKQFDHREAIPVPAHVVYVQIEAFFPSALHIQTKAHADHEAAPGPRLQVPRVVSSLACPDRTILSICVGLSLELPFALGPSEAEIEAFPAPSHAELQKLYLYKLEPAKAAKCRSVEEQRTRIERRSSGYSST
eukprot:6205632-Pleurochrysis_carterae.AAC.2